MHTGMSTRDALREAERLGCRVEHQNATGELVIKHPRASRPIRVQVPVRRKDAPRAFTAWLKRLAKL